MLSEGVLANVKVGEDGGCNAFIWQDWGGGGGGGVS